jgi:hypothetical protein
MASIVFWAAIVVIFVGLSLVSLFIAPADANQGFADTAAVIAFAGMAAIAIERTAEIVWTIIGRIRSLGEFWPIREIDSSLDQLETQARALTEAHFTNAQAFLKRAIEAGGVAADRLEQAKVVLGDLENERTEAVKKLGEAAKLAPSNRRVQMLSEVSSRMSTQLKQAIETAETLDVTLANAVNGAVTLADGAVELIASLKDNPLRRISTLMVGAGAGAVVASLAGLNLFSAILGTPAEGVTTMSALHQLMLGSWGVLFTGWAIGLGAGPTHELVRGLQAVKQSGETRGVASPTAKVMVSDRNPNVRALRL